MRSQALIETFRDWVSVKGYGSVSFGGKELKHFSVIE